MAQGKGPRYKVDRELGRGAFGVVYLARDNLLRRDVALKMMAIPEGTSEEERRHQVDRFYREARAAAGLAHPNVVIIHDISKSNERHFISMEFLEGSPLSELIAGGPMPVDRAVRLADQALAALSYAHSKQVVHRDIKPDNIFVLKDDHVKLVDFGLARVQASTTITRTGTVMGSPGYIAPEVVEGHQADARTDVFSFGVVLYEMLTGKRPFGPETPFESLVHVIYRIVSEDPEPPSRANPAVPAALDEVIARALAKDPADRYQDAGEFRGALAEASGGLAPEAVKAAPSRGEPAHSQVAATGDLQAQATMVKGEEEAPAPTEVRQFEERIEGLDDGGGARRPRGGRRKWLALAGAGVVLAGIAVLVLFLTGVLPGGGSGNARVPNLINLDEQVAVRTLQDAGLKPGKKTPGWSPTIWKGKVMRQFPDAGKPVPTDSTVDYWVSVGTDPVQVPEVIGKTKEEAVAVLEAYGLKPDLESGYFGGIPAGAVGDVKPEQGTLVARGDKVTLVINDGKPAQDKQNPPGSMPRAQPSQPTLPRQ
ncbi:MAG: protein kinase [Actinobacteria bacterium]|nr:protein kinase [Actinomycetota bacterium]MBU2688561.1 protein kinase [Actinomycetota bacterium]